MTGLSENSGFHHRVHAGHFANFHRKLVEAQSSEELSRILTTARMALQKQMLEPSQFEALASEYETRLRNHR